MSGNDNAYWDNVDCSYLAAIMFASYELEEAYEE